MGNKMESSIFVSDPIKVVFLKLTDGFYWHRLYKIAFDMNTVIRYVVNLMLPYVSFSLLSSVTYYDLILHQLLRFDTIN